MPHDYESCAWLYSDFSGSEYRSPEVCEAKWETSLSLWDVTLTCVGRAGTFKFLVATVSGPAIPGTAIVARLLLAVTARLLLTVIPVFGPTRRSAASSISK